MPSHDPFFWLHVVTSSRGAITTSREFAMSSAATAVSKVNICTDASLRIVSVFVITNRVFV